MAQAMSGKVLAAQRELGRFNVAGFVLAIPHLCSAGADAKSGEDASASPALCISGACARLKCCACRLCCIRSCCMAAFRRC